MSTSHKVMDYQFCSFLAIEEIMYHMVIHFSLSLSGKRQDAIHIMYHFVTDETVILGMSLSRYRNVNKSQSDGLTVLFLAGI